MRQRRGRPWGRRTSCCLAFNDGGGVVEGVEGFRQWPVLGGSGGGFGIRDHLPINDSQWDVGWSGVVLWVKVLVGGECVKGTFVVPPPMGDGIFE